jgi:hypothetical protein
MLPCSPLHLFICNASCFQGKYRRNPFSLFSSFQAGKVDIKERRKFNLPIIPSGVVH